MARKPSISLEAVLAAIDACGGHKTQAAKRLGVSRGVVWRVVSRFEKAGGKVPAKQSPPEEQFQVSESGDERTIWSVGTSVRTVQDALAKAEVDLREWEVVEQTINSWPTAMKLKTADGETPHRVWNWQVKLKLRRRIPKPIMSAVKELLADLYKHPLPHPKVRRIVHRHTHLLEISLYDAHLGKRCWGAETGEDYDLKIAESDYCHAVDDLIARLAGFDVESIKLPIGHDLFQTDNWSGTTTAGTVVDSVDDRPQKVFKTVCRAVQYAVQRCREIADTEVLWVPGNHDWTISFYLCEWLAAIFANDKHVTVDSSPRSRKYRTWGVTLLGYTHGDTAKQAKHSKLPLIMATDVPDLWAASKFRAWRCGHFHKRAMYDYTAGDTFNGVRVDVLPSISGTDRWHYEQGYVNNVRTAEAWLWEKTLGFVGQFSVLTESQKRQWRTPCRKK